MKTNRLAAEKSPYLLQHAHNPVDWYPWGEEAFAKAKAADKPILLSIGYSTCHWCHVMERESFENEAIAALMNRHFVSIKLDREERPDVDRIYMTAVQALTGQGGWPLNVFLTPELKPFFGGTYFPPEARWGQPGFPQLLERIAELWKTKRGAIDEDSRRLTEALEGFAGRRQGGGPIPDGAFRAAYEELAERFDAERGGFGTAPKFPMPVNLDFLLRYWARTKEPKALDMAVKTLKAMAQGGIYDQLGGGFHRYSTDALWRVPHFEKMLYDNAQLTSLLIEAHQATGDASLARIARETISYVLRDMTSPEGGFFSAEDADSLAEGGEHKSEGAFYVWRAAEVRQALGPQAEGFMEHFGVEENGNALHDPHGELEGKNVLYVSQEGPSFEKEKLRLLEFRSKRPRPHLDDKIITAWNGLMISGLAKAGEALQEPSYLEAAAKAAGFIRKNLFKDGRLLRMWRDGGAKGAAFSDDYAFLTQGLLDLSEASGERSWLDWAIELHDAQQRLFAGPEGGLFLTAEGQDERLLVRVMEDSDNVEPSASSVCALNGLRLFNLTGEERFREAAEKTLRLFGPLLAERPLSLPAMLAAADYARGPVAQIVILGSEGAAALRREVARRFLPRRSLLTAADGARPKFLKDAPPAKKAAAYVCRDFSCKLPVTDPAELGRLLDD